MTVTMTVTFSVILWTACSLQSAWYVKLREIVAYKLTLGVDVSAVDTHFI